MRMIVAQGMTTHRQTLSKILLQAAEATKPPTEPVSPQIPVGEFLDQLFAEDLHAKRVQSLSNGVMGEMHAAAASIHAIGRGLALATGADPKHAIKQIDRLLSNPGIETWQLFENWVPFVVAERKELVVALDWTEFDKDNQATIALHMITSHGRTTPLVWKTVRKSELANRRNEYEDDVIERFHAILPPDVRVTVLADRGFGDQFRYQYLDVLGWDYVIRFRANILVTDVRGTSRLAGEWVPSSGRAKKLRHAKVTNEQTSVSAVVCVHKKKMKEPWCLATSRAELRAAQIIELYGRRFTIEETFRDTKDPRYGLGLSATHIKRPERRDRVLLLAAITQALLTLLGAASEATGLDRVLKANTVKKRTHSLFNQGCYWYQAIPTMPEERLRILMKAFGEIVTKHAVFRDIFGVI